MIVSASQNYQPPIKCPGLSGRPKFQPDLHRHEGYLCLILVYIALDCLILWCGDPECSYLEGQ